MIDREKAIKEFDDAKELVWRETDEDAYVVGYNNGLETGKSIVLAMLKEQPEIVRCRDCKWRGRCEGYDLIYDDDGFCSNGERRTDDARQGEG